MLVISIIGRPVRTDGHHFSYHIGVSQACKILRFEHLVVAGRAPRNADLWPDNWTHLPILDKPEGPRIWSLGTDVSAWRRIFEASGRKAYGRPVLVLLDSCDGSSLPAMALGANWCRPKIAATFMPILRMRGFLSIAYRIISRPWPILWPRVRFELATDSDLIAETLKKNYGATAKWLPNPHIVRCGDRTEVGEEGRLPFRLWFPGEPRKDKGQKIVERLAIELQNRDLGFVLIVDRKGLGHVPICDRIKALSGPHLPNEFRRLMADTDAVLLPYDPVRYREATSVILVEAVCSGKVPFVTRGSWLSAQLARFGLDELAFDWSEHDVFDRFCQLYVSNDVRAKLREMAAQIEREHGPAAFASVLKRAT